MKQAFWSESTLVLGQEFTAPVKGQRWEWRFSETAPGPARNPSAPGNRAHKRPFRAANGGGTRKNSSHVGLVQRASVVLPCDRRLRTRRCGPRRSDNERKPYPRDDREKWRGIELFAGWWERKNRRLECLRSAVPRLRLAAARPRRFRNVRGADSPRWLLPVSSAPRRTRGPAARHDKGDR